MALDRAIAWQADGTPLRVIPYNPNRAETFNDFVARVAALDDVDAVGQFDNVSTEVGGNLLSVSDSRQWVRDPANNLPTSASVQAGIDEISGRSLADAIARKKTDVDALYLQKIAITNWTNSADSQAYQVQSGDLSQQRIIGRLSTAKEGAVPIQWRMADNSEPNFNLAEFTEMTLAVASHVEACFFAATTHKDAIAALTDEQAVADYDYSGGWPN